MKSSAHAHGTEFGGEFLYSLKLPYDSQGNGRFATDSQVCNQTLGGDPRTGMFHQTRPSASDSVKGVLMATMAGWLCCLGLMSILANCKNYEEDRLKECFCISSVSIGFQ